MVFTDMAAQVTLTLEGLVTVLPDAAVLCRNPVVVEIQLVLDPVVGSGEFFVAEAA